MNSHSYMQESLIATVHCGGALQTSMSILLARFQLDPHGIVYLLSGTIESYEKI